MKKNNKKRLLRKKSVFDSLEFKEIHTDMVMEGWKDWLDGVNLPNKPKEIYFCHSTENEVIELVNEFELRYNIKLKYRIVNLSYISYYETIVSEKYDG